MKCTNCEGDVQPTYRVCPHCETKLANCGTEVQAVICPKPTEEGQACGSPLKPNQKFCGKCRWKVDPRIFSPGAFMCNRETEGGALCSNIIVQEDNYCVECGAKAERPGKPSGIFYASLKACMVRLVSLSVSTTSFAMGPSRMLYNRSFNVVGLYSLMSIFISPATKLGGYTGMTMSVCPSVRLSVRIWV